MRRILHVIPSLGAETGGPATAVLQMAISMSDSVRNESYTVEIVSSQNKKDAIIALYEKGEIGHNNIHLLTRFTEFYTYTPKINKWLSENIREFDLIHIHGMFSHLPIATGRLCSKFGIPYVVTPHGIANRHGMKHKPIRKLVSMWLFDRALLSKASIIHMTSAQEDLEFADLKIDVLTKIVPLALPKQTTGTPDRLLAECPHLDGKDIIVFLGRLNPIKNIECLIEAFAILAALKDKAHLLICGSGVAVYEVALKRLAKSLGVEHRITWLGFVGPAKRADALAIAKCAALISKSESFGLSALESLAAGLPCVLSKGVAIAKPLEQAGLAIRVTATPTEVANALGQALKLKSPSFGAKASAYVEANFAEQTICAKMALLYEAALSNKG
jgi:glycosyltransferase involved in cell wall biosynthesis